MGFAFINGGENRQGEGWAKTGHTAAAETGDGDTAFHDAVLVHV